LFEKNSYFSCTEICGLHVKEVSQKIITANIVCCVLSKLNVICNCVLPV